jgi:hypothetical protein
MTNFWNQLESKQLNQTTIKQTLIEKLGEPNNQLATNCLIELTKKINSYYSEDQPKNYTIYTLTGSLTSPEQILERKFRDGKRMGQTYYILKVGSEKLQATQEELAPSKWEPITKLAIIGQDLVFKYRKFYTNKQLLDYYPTEKKGD